MKTCAMEEIGKKRERKEKRNEGVVGRAVGNRPMRVCYSNPRSACKGLNSERERGSERERHANSAQKLEEKNGGWSLPNEIPSSYFPLQPIMFY